MNGTGEFSGFELFHHGPQADTSKLTALSQLATRLPLRKQKKVLSAMSGGHASAIRGRGLDYAENRLYQAGDDIRAMDWRVTARTGEAHIKVYQEERERPVLLVGDFRASMNFGSRRTLKQLVCAELLSLLGWAAVREGDRLGALLFSETDELDIRPRTGNRQVLQLIRSITDFCDHDTPRASQSDEQQRFYQLMLNLRRIARPGTAIYIVSDWRGMSSDAEAQLFQLRRHCDITAIQVHDPLEAELPDMGLMTLTDGHQRSNLHTHRQQRQQHQQAFAEHQQALHNHMMRLSTPLISVCTTDHPLTRLREGMGFSQNASQPIDSSAGRSPGSSDGSSKGGHN